MLCQVYLNYNNQSLTSRESICEAFSLYFHSNFLDSSSNTNYICAPPLESASSFDISSISVSVDHVKKLLTNIDSSKAAGPDNISPKFLIRCAKTLALPVAILFRKSLACSIVPKIWKSAFITPVHKKGDKTEVVNYRPISKLCVIAKILERIVYDQVYSALKHAFSPFQHGFLRGKSTVTNLILLNDFLTAAMDKGNQVDVIYTDYNKAFDRIDHFILLQKLNSMGIRGDLLRWFSSYLENRSQAVALHNYTSSWISVPSGCPQGSLLGPLLFTVYVNDIDACLRSSKLLCFADDMKIFAAISSLDDMSALQADLRRLEDYCQSKQLDLNPAKCSVVTYSRKRSVLMTSNSLNGQALPRCNSVRDLGVYHDSRLIFDSHVDAIVHLEL